MRVVFGVYDAWLAPEFYVNQGKAYRVGIDVDETVVKQHSDAFSDELGTVPGFEEIETATAGPGEVRRGPGRPRKDA